MANQFNNKIVLGNGEVLIDLTLDDVKPEHVQKDIYFHDKSGARVQGTSTKTVDASGATAEAAEVLVNRTFGKGAEIQTGTMPDNSGNNIEIKNLQGTPIPLGYSDGSSVAKVSAADIAKLIPSNIKEGVTILGVTGDYGADDISSDSLTVTPSFVERTINPSDHGVTFFSAVKVNPIAVVRKDNQAGGVTVTIG